MNLPDRMSFKNIFCFASIVLFYSVLCIPPLAKSIPYALFSDAVVLWIVAILVLVVVLYVVVNADELTAIIPIDSI